MRTGLEVKFSYAWLGAMVFQGISTADPAVYQDALCTDPALRNLAERIKVEGVPDLPDTAAEIAIEMRDGTQLRAHHDLMEPIDPNTLATRLRDKGHAVIGERASEIWDALFETTGLPARAIQL